MGIENMSSGRGIIVTRHKATRIARARYNRVAAIYDKVEGFMERGAMARWRRRLWQGVDGGRVLEVGVGTGRNFAHYPPGLRVMAIDFSPKMLARAQRRAAEDGVAVGLSWMDVQALAFPDATFDLAVATCVFCSVPDPVAGLKEMRRVLKPGGRALFLEHMRSQTPLGLMMDLINPLVVRLGGENINRRTLANLERAGFAIERVEKLFLDIFFLIEARPR